MEAQCTTAAPMCREATTNKAAEFTAIHPPPPPFRLNLLKFLHNGASALCNLSESLYKCIPGWLWNDLLIDSVHFLGPFALAPMNMSVLSEGRLLDKLGRPTIIGAKMLFSGLFGSTVERENEPTPTWFYPVNCSHAHNVCLWDLLFLPMEGIIIAVFCEVATETGVIQQIHHKHG